MRRATIPALAFVIVAMLMIGIGAASAQTATPTATVTKTPFGTPIMTATPTPTSTPRPAYTLNDYHFLNPSGPWVASSSSVEWSPSRYKVPSGQYISQTVSYITDTFPCTITLRLAAATTSTVDVYIGVLARSLTITSTRLSTYSFTQTVTFPKTIKIGVSSGGPVTVDAVGFRRADGDLGSPFDPGGAYENPIETAESADISGMVEWFTPLNLTHMFTGEFTPEWTPIMRTVGSIVATLLTIATPQIVSYYIAGRIIIMCALWFFGFVMQKIGKPIPNADGHVVVLRGNDVGRPEDELIGSGRDYNVAFRRSKLPSIGPRVLRRGRSRRARW